MKARFNDTKHSSKDRIVRDFTERQKDILGGVSETPPSKKEITVIIKKAEALGILGIEESLFSMYEEFFVQEAKEDTRTLSELRAELQAITPWPINWQELKIPKYKKAAPQATW